MGESSESMRKLRLSTKFPHQEISEITILYAVFIADFAYEVLANTGKSPLTIQIGIVAEKVLVFGLLKPFHAIDP